MRNGSLTRYVLALATAFVVGAAWPPAGFDHPGNHGVDGPIPAAPATSAFAVSAFELEISDPVGGDPTAAPHGTATTGSHVHPAPGHRVRAPFPSLALQGFRAQPTRAPPVLSA